LKREFKNSRTQEFKNGFVGRLTRQRRVPTFWIKLREFGNSGIHEIKNGFVGWLAPAVFIY
jgi:hypothetical protein